MEKILAKRYGFCDFSNIAGFPHPVPTINEWDDYLPRFRGSKYDHPGEHLFNFHQCMLEHGFVHEDVLIKLFKFSLEGNAREWCQSLPAVSIHSLKDFHVAFNSYYEKIYSADLLFPECCHEFHLSKLELHEEYVVVEDTIHHDQEIIDSPHDNLSDAFDIISNAPTDVCCHEDEIVPSEKFEDVEQSDISASDSFRSAKIEEDSLQFLDLQWLSNLQLEQVNHHPKCIDVAAAYVMSSPYFPDLQKKVDHSTYEKSDGSEDLKGPDHQSVLCVSPTDLKQPAFNNEIIKGSFQHLFNLQLDQQSKEALLCKFDDPFAGNLESMSSIDVKNFLSDENYLYHLFKSLFCIIWSSLLFGSRSITMTVNLFLSWLHWKSSFT
jgi:hypothetical protein